MKKRKRNQTREKVRNKRKREKEEKTEEQQEGSAEFALTVSKCCDVRGCGSVKLSANYFCEPSQKYPDLILLAVHDRRIPGN